MGLRDDLERFRTVGEQRRQDLADFIEHGDLGASGPESVRVPIKIVDLPEFQYDPRERGGVGRGGDGTPDVGDPVGEPHPAGEDGEGGEPGEGAGEHEYYEMDPAEFARDLDETLGLDLEPKGKRVLERTEGDFTDLTRTGPDSTLDVGRLFREGIRRKLAMEFDEAFMREILKVEGITPREAFEWARTEGIPVSMAWLTQAQADLPAAERDTWPSIEAVSSAVDREPIAQRVRREGIGHVPYRPEDERYRHPEIEEVRQRNVVVVNVRDVSGSMRERKRELVERTFTPLDWYLTGKYDHAEFRYVAHDVEAWEVEREAFFGIRSGGGTRISSAYELVAEILEEYPWSEWNRYVFAAGDSENSSNDTGDRVIPLMEDIDANLHAYVETQPSGEAINATHADELTAHFGSDSAEVAVASVSEPADVTDAIYEILSTEEDST